MFNQTDTTTDSDKIYTGDNFEILDDTKAYTDSYTIEYEIPAHALAKARSSKSGHNVVPDYKQLSNIEQKEITDYIEVAKRGLNKSFEYFDQIKPNYTVLSDFFFLEKIIPTEKKIWQYKLAECLEKHKILAEYELNDRLSAFWKEVFTCFNYGFIHYNHLVKYDPLKSFVDALPLPTQFFMLNLIAQGAPYIEVQPKTSTAISKEFTTLMRGANTTFSRSGNTDKMRTCILPAIITEETTKTNASNATKSL